MDNCLTERAVVRRCSGLWRSGCQNTLNAAARGRVERAAALVWCCWYGRALPCGQGSSPGAGLGTGLRWEVTMERAGRAGLGTGLRWEVTMERAGRAGLGTGLRWEVGRAGRPGLAEGVTPGVCVSPIVFSS